MYWSSAFVSPGHARRAAGPPAAPGASPSACASRSSAEPDDDLVELLPSAARRRCPRSPWRSRGRAGRGRRPSRSARSMCPERTFEAPKSIEPTSQASSMSFGSRGERAGVRVLPVLSRSSERARSFARRDSSISNRRRIFGGGPCRASRRASRGGARRRRRSSSGKGRGRRRPRGRSGRCRSAGRSGTSGSRSCVSFLSRAGIS